MKVICTTERKIEEETSCRKEYCCKKMAAASTARKTKDSFSHNLSANFHMRDDKIEVQTHSNYDGDSHSEKINFCPWCATKVKVVRIKVDNTGLPPREPTRTAPPKKKHWWNL